MCASHNSVENERVVLVPCSDPFANDCLQQLLHSDRHRSFDLFTNSIHNKPFQFRLILLLYVLFCIVSMLCQRSFLFLCFSLWTLFDLGSVGSSRSCAGG